MPSYLIKTDTYLNAFTQRQLPLNFLLIKYKLVCSGLNLMLNEVIQPAGRAMTHMVILKGSHMEELIWHHSLFIHRKVWNVSSIHAVRISHKDFSQSLLHCYGTDAQHSHCCIH